MNPTLVRLEDVADLSNLSWAYWRAARGHRHRPDVAAMALGLDTQLQRLGDEIRDGTVRVGCYKTFVVHDPKARTIHAPTFRERVLHHALMRHLEPLFEQALVADTFACRIGRGSLAAVRRAQQHVRRFPWYVKSDIRRYFDSVDHDILISLIARRVKGRAVLALCERIVRAYEAAPGKGLPIGALTSQHFANLYLAGFDRFLQGLAQTRAMVRYMDDTVWWCDDRCTARRSLHEAREFLTEQLRLEVKDSVQIQPSARGVMLCGFRVLPDRLALSRRRRVRFAAARRHWENAWIDAAIDSLALQRGAGAALAITAHADALGWRRAQLLRVPPVDA